MTSPARVRLGLPYLPGDPNHPFLRTVADLDAQILVSVGSLYRPAEGGFRRAPLTAWEHGPALDSAGFVAQARFGGYRWSVEAYVDQVVTNFPGQSDDDDEDEPVRCALPMPWDWWSAPDYCCEEEIASNRAEVESRIARTTESFAETMDFLEGWRDEGDNTTPDPLPIIQGRTPADYLESARQLTTVIDAGRCICLTGPDPEACDATWHRDRPGLPSLVGVGSVCRRDLHGPEGLLSVLDALHVELPSHVRLHLFGVKSDALAHLGRYGSRVESTDSVAWDAAARREASRLRRVGAPNPSCTLALKERHMRDWYLRQVQAPAQFPGPPSMFGSGLRPVRRTA